MSETRRNAAANVFGRVWAAASIYVFLPVYLRFLGAEQFGLIAFFASLQIVLTVSLTGWTKALRRFFALPHDATGSSPADKYRVLRSYELAFGGLGIVMVGGVALGAPWLATDWLSYSGLDQAQVATSIRLMGGVIAAQLLASCYSGCLHGLRLQVRATAAEVTWSIVRSVAALLTIAFVERSIVAFYASLLVCDLLYAVALRQVVLQELHVGGRVLWRPRDLRLLKGLAPMSLGLTAVSIVYLVNTQVDRLIISRYLGLGPLGLYSMANTLGVITVVFSGAIATTAFPLFTHHLGSGGKQAAADMFMKWSRALTLVIAASGAHLALYYREVFGLWTGNDDVAVELGSAAVWVIIGCALLSLQQLPYEYLLSRGITRVNVAMSLMCLPYSLTVTPFLTIRYGLRGAAISWAVLMAISTLAYVWYVWRTQFSAGFGTAVVWGMALPVVAAIAVAWPIRALAVAGGLSGWLLLVVGVMSGVIYCTVSLRWLGGWAPSSRVAQAMRVSGKGSDLE